MKLRFAEDRRTLAWAFLLFPLSPVLVLLKPGLLPWLAPLLLYGSYLSGVLSHNHNHCPVFSSRRANLVYGAYLSIFYGFPSFAWVPTHNQNHHRYLNGEGDATRTSRHTEHDGLLAALTYPFASGRFQAPLVLAYAREAFRSHPTRRQRIVLETAVMLLGHAAALGLFVGLRGWTVGGLGYVFALGLPALLGTYWMMLTNYLQHVGCEPGSEHDHSRNFVSPFWNWFVFDNGLHTVHHEHPGMHWSRYRALHARANAQIAPALNHGSILGYAARTYLRLGRAGQSGPS
jgi:beta-carotene hydroxylase